MAFCQSLLNSVAKLPSPAPHRAYDRYYWTRHLRNIVKVSPDRLRNTRNHSIPLIASTWILKRVYQWVRVPGLKAGRQKSNLSSFRGRNWYPRPSLQRAGIEGLLSRSLNSDAVICDHGFSSLTKIAQSALGISISMTHTIADQRTHGLRTDGLL